MAEQLLTINGQGLSGNDDDAGSVMNEKSISKNDKLLSVKSQSIDSNSNTNEDDASETGIKITKRKSRRQTEFENPIDHKRLSTKYNPWYKKIDLSKPLKIIGLLILIYLMWVKRDVWAPRLLTSNTRIHRSGLVKNDQESKNSSTISTTIPSDSSNKEDKIENIEEKNELENNNNEDLISSSSSSPSKSTSSQKLNLKTRRNKMSFSQDRQKKKKYSSPDSSIDGQIFDDYKEEEEEDKSSQIELSKINSTKEIHQYSIDKNNSKKLVTLKSSLSLSTYNDILEQIRKNLKLQSRNQEFLSKLTKITGLNKNKLYRFIYKKEYQLMTLQTFMAILDTFNLMLLIVPK